MTFASNLATGDVIDFVQILGNVLDIGQPSDDTVTAAKLNNDIISGQTALTAEPDDTDEFLVSDAGTIKRIDYSLIKGGGITMADQWRLSANVDAPSGDLTSNLERVDTSGQGTLGTGMTESSGIFSFPTTGIYLIQYSISISNVSASDQDRAQILLKVTTDNSSYANLANPDGSVDGTANGATNVLYGSSLVDVTNTSNVKVKFTATSFKSGTRLNGATNENQTHFTFIRLGDT
jgi:hypothetical protein